MKKAKAEQIVMEAYSLALGRSPDPAGLTHHVKALRSGRTTPYSLMKSLLESDERKARDDRGYVSDRNAKTILTKIFRALLRRDPQSDNVDGLLDRLEAGPVSLGELYEEIVESDEFSLSWAKIRPEAAPSILTAAFATLLGREPERAAIEGLVERAAKEDVTIPQIYAEIMNSPEFGAAVLRFPAVAARAGTQPASVSMGAPDELVLLLQDLIATRLSDGGCRWALPPVFPHGRTVSVAQAAGLIRTLAMLGGAPATMRSSQH